jgi:hypothetical protein
MSLTSKIARLPFNLREQLNYRLQNGEPGTPILDWLNQKPIVKKTLLKWFNGQPINKQNLSDWRHGGYRDWLRHQSRQQTIQRLAEQGTQLDSISSPRDHCESFSQIVIAEMADELEHLHELPDRDRRWQRLREISRELARLQHGFNHSRAVELAWTKHNDPFDALAAQSVNSSQPQSSQAPRRNSSEDQTADGTNAPVKPLNEIMPAPAASLSSPKGGEGRGEEAFSFASSVEAIGIQDQKATAQIETVDRAIYHRRCGRGCVCPHCHPEDGIYPYSQAVKDAEAHQDHTSPYWIRGHLRLWVTHFDCDCYCNCEITHPYPNHPSLPNAR